MRNLKETKVILDILSFRHFNLTWKELLKVSFLLSFLMWNELFEFNLMRCKDYVWNIFVLGLLALKLQVVL